MEIAVYVGFLSLFMLATEVIFFEMSRKKMANNPMWALSLNRPFRYNRIVYMVFLCSMIYILNFSIRFTAEWVLYFLLLIAIAIVADIVVQYLVYIYSNIRCKDRIIEAKEMREYLENIDTSIEATNYVEPVISFNEKEILDYYIHDDTHVAFMGVDHGEFVKEYNRFTEATFFVEQYGAKDTAEVLLEEVPVKVTELTDTRQLPFKDGKIDVFVNRFGNYDKGQVYRVLKTGGYAVILQNGTANLQELLKMYIPFGIKGTWDANSCAATLSAIGMKVIDAKDSYGSIQFTDIQSLITYAKRLSADLADVKKYITFYMVAYDAIKTQGYYEVTTQQFVVVAQK